MARQYIYQMRGLSKIVGNGREILKDISLSFYPGAKIGLIGHNGSGKSTILKIMAGVDSDYEGHTWIDPDATIGHLPKSRRSTRPWISEATSSSAWDANAASWIASIRSTRASPRR